VAVRYSDYSLRFDGFFTPPVHLPGSRAAALLTAANNQTILLNGLFDHRLSVCGAVFMLMNAVVIL
jgi:hypothetical protein